MIHSDEEEVERAWEIGAPEAGRTIVREEVILDQPVTRRELLTALGHLEGTHPGARLALLRFREKWGLA